jgi:hypothetical protein
VLERTRDQCLPSPEPEIHRGLQRCSVAPGRLPAAPGIKAKRACCHCAADVDHHVEVLHREIDVARDGAITPDRLVVSAAGPFRQDGTQWRRHLCPRNDTRCADAQIVDEILSMAADQNVEPFRQGPKVRIKFAAVVLGLQKAQARHDIRQCLQRRRRERGIDQTGRELQSDPDAGG